MNRRSITTFAVGALAAGAMVGGPIAAASASDSGIKTDLLHTAPRLEKAQAKIARALRKAGSTNSTRVLLRADRAEDKILHDLIRELRRTPASSSHGAAGKTKIVRGLTMILHSNYDINSGLAHHHLTMKQIKRDHELDLRGSALYKKGVKELFEA